MCIAKLMSNNNRVCFIYLMPRLYTVSIQPSSSIPSRCFCRTLSRCQFNSRDGAFTEKGWSREKSRRVCFNGRGRNGRIGLAVVFNDGCRNEETTGHVYLPSFLSFVRWRVIISRRTKTRYHDIKSALVPLSLPFFQILL